MSEFHKSVAASATWDLIKWLVGAAIVSGTLGGIAMWQEFHSLTIMIGPVLWLVLMVSTCVMIVFYVKEKWQQQPGALSGGHFRAGLDDLEVIHVAALQFMLSGDARESELVAYLNKRGFDVPPNYLDGI